MLKTEKIFIIGNRYKDRLQPGLDRLGLNVLWLPDNPDIARPVQGHVDLSVLITPSKNAVLAPYLKDSKIPSQLQKYGYKIKIADIIQKPVYPFDAQLCICQLGNKYLANSKTVWTELLTEEYKCLKIIECRQGYTRCSTFTVNSVSAITSDNGIAQALEKEQIEVLQLKPGCISLPGYSYGFIGGAGFMIDKTHAVFSGVLNDRIEQKKLEEYFASKNISVSYLTDQGMFDFGGAVKLETETQDNIADPT